MLGVALFFIAAVATARFVAAKSELAGGRAAIGGLAACVAVGKVLESTEASDRAAFFPAQPLRKKHSMP